MKLQTFIFLIGLLVIQSFCLKVKKNKLKKKTLKAASSAITDGDEWNTDENRPHTWAASINTNNDGYNTKWESHYGFRYKHNFVNSKGNYSFHYQLLDIKDKDNKNLHINLQT